MTTIELIELLEMDEMAVLRNLAYCPLSKDQILKVRREAAQRLRELDKPDCVWVKLPCGRDSSGTDINSYDPSCIIAYTDEPLPMKLTKFCHLCGGAIKAAT